MRRIIKYTLIIACLDLAATIANASLGLKCSEVLNATVHAFTQDDFPQLHVLENKNNFTWSIWAANEANRVEDQLKNSHSTNNIIEYLRLARSSGMFAHNEPPDTVSWRFIEPEPYKTGLGFFRYLPDLDSSGNYYKDTTFNPQSNELAELAWKEVSKALQYSDRSGSRVMPHN